MRGWAAILVGCSACAVQAQAPGTASDAPAYSLDPSHTFVHWEVVHLGTSTVRGRFDRSTGAVQFDAKAQRLDVSISVDIASADSGVPVLDRLLRGPSMLDATAYPQAYFTARTATFDAEALREVRGELTLHGVSRPLSLHALRWRCGLNPVFMREVCGGDFEAELDRSAFGINHSVPFVSDRVRLLIQIEAVRL